MALEDIKEQQVIINSREKTVLVTARPGRGKTTVALLTAGRIISDEEIKPSQTVLFLTFSRNAVYQIEQASGLILDKETKSRLWISTYHAFMWWVLRTFGRFHNLPTRLDVMRETMGKAARNSANLIDIDMPEMPFYLARNYSAITYEDFAPLTLSLMNNSHVLLNAIRNRFPVVIVDEFQDTNQEQWELIKLISENSRLICFADPNQMIFRWRGASGNRLNQLVVQRNAKEYFLQSNCKRTEEHTLLDFAEAILDNKTGSVNEQIVWRNRFLVSYPGVNALGYYLKGQIRSFYQDYQKRKPAHPIPSIAIAAFSNNAAKAIQDALAKSTPKAQKTYNCSLLEGQVDDAVEELLIQLAAWVSGGVTRHLVQAMKLVGGLLIQDVTKANNSLLALLSPEKLLSKEIQSKGITKDVLESFEYLPRPIEDPKEAISQSVLAIERLMERKAVSNVISLSDLNDAQLKITNILETIPNKPALTAIDLVRTRLSTERIQIDILDKVMPTRGIVSSTLHKLKGREFDYVCVVTQLGDKLRSKDDDEIDARRLMYVALTRARYDARVLYVESNPCFLLNSFLSR